MIIVGLNGRLGNQMFGMALYQMLLSQGKEVYLDLACNRNSGLEKDIISDTQYNIDLFSLDYRVADSKMVEEFLRDRENRNLWKRWEYRIFPKHCQYYEEKKAGEFNKLVFNLDNVYLNGYWQSEKYFMTIKEKIHELYQFPCLFTSYQSEMLEKINKTNSVSIHIRRGDYLNHPEIYGTIGMDYYIDAIHYIQSRKENIHFYVFTNDITWAKENFKAKNITVIETSNDLLANNMDMALMAACKDNIIANSSFSWWGAWLNSTPDKIVIAPKKWEVNATTKDIWCDDWIKI